MKQIIIEQLQELEKEGHLSQFIYYLQQEHGFSSTKHSIVDIINWAETTNETLWKTLNLQLQPINLLDSRTTREEIENVTKEYAIKLYPELYI